MLISFCVKPEYRSRGTLIEFGDFIKREVGRRFDCYLYNNNTRAIKFLHAIGMRIVKSNNLITLLSI
jgi:ribosomal protein S18 acetylase RimI-like enzyme